MTTTSALAGRLRQVVDDDAQVEAIAQLLVEHDPEAPPAVNKARIRFEAANIRATLRATATVLEDT